jgi:hypothetical protein
MTSPIGSSIIPKSSVAEGIWVEHNMILDDLC